jgi:glycyl-tRNA synthetase beta chain
MKNTVFLEIFSEEIPYKTQIKLEKKVLQFFVDAFAKDGITIKDDQVKYYITQFRITIYIKDIISNITDHKVVEYVRNFMIYLSNEVMNPAMKWPSSEIKWVRPIRNIIIRNEYHNIIENFFGINSTNQVYINKFEYQNFNPLGDTMEFYTKLMNENGIILDRENRTNLINTTKKEIEQKYHITSVANKELIYEISSLTEKPFPIEVQIPQQFLSLPYQLIDLVLTKNQRYIMFKKQDSDEISEYVLIIAQNDNMKENIEIIKNGNLKVMTARLEDASFYINLDKKAYYQKEKKNWDKEKLFHKVAKMELCSGFLYENLFDIYKKIGTKCCNEEGNKNQIIEILQLAKSDLCTNLVSEFPELQGVICYYYFAQEYDVNLSSFFRKQYEEFDYKDENQTTNNAMLFFIERLAYIIAMYKNNNQPTSSGDLFAVKKRMDDLIHTIYFLSNKQDCTHIHTGIIDVIEIELTKEQRVEMQKLYQKRLVNFIKLHTKIENQNQKNILSHISHTNTWDDILCINTIIKSIQMQENFRIVYKRILPFVDFSNQKYTTTEPDFEEISINKYKRDMMKEMLKLNTTKITEFFQQYKIKDNPIEEQNLVNHVLTFIASKIKILVTQDLNNKYADHLIVAKF